MTNERAVAEVTEAIEKRATGMSLEDYVDFLDAITDEIRIMKDAAKDDFERQEGR